MTKPSQQPAEFQLCRMTIIGAVFSFVFFSNYKNKTKWKWNNFDFSDSILCGDVADDKTKESV